MSAMVAADKVLAPVPPVVERYPKRKADILALPADERDHLHQATQLFFRLIECREPWATEELFSILYDETKALHKTLVRTLPTGMTFSALDSKVLRVARGAASLGEACMRLERFDVLRELLARGRPPGLQVLPSAPGATTPEGELLDSLCSRFKAATTYPAAMLNQYVTPSDAMVDFLLEVDPNHEGLSKLAGTPAGALVVKRLMKQALQAPSEQAQPQVGARRRMNI